MKNRDLHYTSLPRDELPLNSAIQFHLQMHIFFSVSLSLFFPPTRASLMDLARGIAFDASGRTVSFMTLITSCMHEPRYIILNNREVHYAK